MRILCDHKEICSVHQSLQKWVWDTVQDGLRSIHHNICWSTSILKIRFFGFWIWRLACTLSCSMRKINIMFVRSILQRPIASRLPIEYQGCKTAVKKQQETHTNFLGKFNEKVSEVTLFTVLYYHLWPTTPMSPHQLQNLTQSPSLQPFSSNYAQKLVHKT